MVASSDLHETQLKWIGLVESKLRQLVMKLELVESITLGKSLLLEYPTLFLAHPFTKSFELNQAIFTEEEALLARQGTKIVDVDRTGTESVKTIYTTSFYVGIALEDKDPITHIKRKLGK